MTLSDLVARAFEAFGDDLASPPPLSLRGGSAVDSYSIADPFDPALDEPTDAYIEGHAFWGIGYLDARSWRHYLPRLIDYTLRRPGDPAMVVEALIRSLRPPDRYPPRLASLSPAQEAVIREFLELLALGGLVEDAEEEAQQALEEWWLPNPRSRPDAAAIAALRAAPMEYRDVGAGGYRLSVPILLTGSGLKQIPQESRRVETWGGPLCGDAHTIVAINVKPVAFRSFAATVGEIAGLFLDADALSRDIAVEGARRARRLDGLKPGDSPAEPAQLAAVVAETAAEVFTLTIHSWPREDVAREVGRIVGSFRIVAAA